MKNKLAGRLTRLGSPSKKVNGELATPDSNAPGRSLTWSGSAVGDWVSTTLSGRTVTVSVDDVIRVAVFEGERVVSWGTIDTRPLEAFGPVPNPANGTELATEPQAWSAQQLAELLSDLPTSAGRVVIALPHRSSVPRRMQIPNVKRKYRGPLVVSEVTDSLPFRAEDVDVSWRDRPAADVETSSVLDLPEDREHKESQERRDVFAEAAVKTAIDDEVDRFKSAGLRPRAGFSRATALAAAVGLNSCLVVDMGARSASVVLVEEGMPGVVHQVDVGRASNGVASPERVVAVAVERVTAYRGSGTNVGTGDGTGEPPVVLTGLVSDDPELLLRVEASAGRRVVAFDPGFDYPGHFPANEYGVNLGLAAADADRARTERRRSGVTRLNLLGKRHLPPAFPIVKVAAAAALALLAFGVFSFTELTDTTRDTVASLSAQEADLGRKARVHRLELAGVETAKRQAQEAVSLAAAVDLAVADFDREAATLVERAIRALDAADEAEVALSFLVKQGETFKLMGSAATFEAPSTFADGLVRTGLFASVQLQSVEKVGDSVTFNVVAIFASDEEHLGEASPPAAVW